MELKDREYTINSVSSMIEDIQRDFNNIDLDNLSDGDLEYLQDVLYKIWTFI